MAGSDGIVAENLLKRPRRSGAYLSRLLAGEATAKRERVRVARPRRTLSPAPGGSFDDPQVVIEMGLQPLHLGHRDPGEIGDLRAGDACVAA